MAWAEGFEPPTVGVEIRCSVQLSYAHMPCKVCFALESPEVNPHHANYA